MYLTIFYFSKNIYKIFLIYLQYFLKYGQRFESASQII